MKGLQFVCFVCIQGGYLTKGPFLLCYWHPWQFKAQLWNCTSLHKNRLKTMSSLVSKPQLPVPQREVGYNSSKLTAVLDTWSYESGKCKNQCSKTEELLWSMGHCSNLGSYIPENPIWKTLLCFEMKKLKIPCSKEGQVQFHVLYSFLHYVGEIYLQILWQPWSAGLP